MAKRLEAAEVSAILRERLQKDFIPALAQLALGVQYVYAIDPVTYSKNRITDPEIIDRVMQHIGASGYGEMTDKKTGDIIQLYVITTVDPDITALKEVFDRALGKSSQKFGFDNESVGILAALSDMSQKAKSRTLTGWE